MQYQQPIYIMPEQQSSWTSWLPWIGITAAVGGCAFLVWKYGISKQSGITTSSGKSVAVIPLGGKDISFAEWDKYYKQVGSQTWKDAAAKRNVTDEQIFEAIGGGKASQGSYTKQQMLDIFQGQKDKIKSLLGIDMTTTPLEVH